MELTHVMAMCWLDKARACSLVRYVSHSVSQDKQLQVALNQACVNGKSLWLTTMQLERAKVALTPLRLQ